MGRIKGYYVWEDDSLTPADRKNGGLHQNLFDQNGNLKGHARFVPAEESDEPGPVFGSETDYETFVRGGGEAEACRRRFRARLRWQPLRSSLRCRRLRRRLGSSRHMRRKPSAQSSYAWSLRRTSSAPMGSTGLSATWRSSMLRPSRHSSRTWSLTRPSSPSVPSLNCRASWGVVSRMPWCGDACDD